MSYKEATFNGELKVKPPKEVEALKNEVEMLKGKVNSLVNEIQELKGKIKN